MIDKSSIPDHWKIVRVKDIAESINYGYTESSSKGIIGPKFLRITDIQDNKVDWSNVPYCKIGKEEQKKYQLQDGDLVFARTGATVGKSFLIKGEIPEAVFASYLIRLRFPKSVFDKFIYNFFQSQLYWRQIAEGQVGIGQPNVNGTKLGQLYIPLPPLSEQQEIVAKIEELFSELDKGKEQLENARQQLKVYRQAVLKWAFEGKLTNTEVKEGELPEGWNPVKLKDICNIVGGVTKGRDFKGKETIFLPYLRVANVQDGYLDLKEIKEIEVLPTDKEKYKLEFGDILYTEGGDKDKLGRGTIWKNEIEDCIHQNHIFRARPISNNINSKFVAYFSQTKTAKNYFLKHGKQTTNLASINLTVLKNLPLSFPPFEEQARIIEGIESRLSVCDKVEETIARSLQQAETLRQSILKQAFEGKLLKNENAVAETVQTVFEGTGF